MFWAKHVRPAQFAIWEPYLRRSRYRTAIVRSGPTDIDDRVLAAVEPMPGCAVVTEPFPDVLAWLRETRDLRGFLYVGSYDPNATVIDAFPAATHVWIGHGESAKKANRHRTATVYDSVFVADYEAVRRYRRSIRGWIAAGKMDPVDPIHLIFLLWSSTQHYADFASQICRVKQSSRLTKQDFEQASDQLVQIILKGCGLTPAAKA